MSFGRFANKFEDEIAAPKASSSLRSLLGRPAPDALPEARRTCLDFSTRFGSILGGAAVGRRIRAGTVGIGAGRRTWIAPPPSARATNNAQYWRDRLGLIHVQTSAVPLVGNALVRVEFQIETSREKVNRKDWKGTLSRHADGLWVIRPTMVHEGNQRFVQAHSADDEKRTRARAHGMTRDLGSPRHLPGEREVLLICGTAATIRFSSVTLLEGMAGEMSARDNTDQHFAEQIASERGWKIS